MGGRHAVDEHQLVGVVKRLFHELEGSRVIGREEDRVIRPAVDVLMKARVEVVQAEGPEAGA